MKSISMRLFILCMIPILLGGCVAVVAAGGAAGGVAYVRGELKLVVEEPIRAVHDAVREAGKELELHAVSAETDLLGGKFIFRNAQDEKITVSTEAETTKSTELSIRVGLFGDQQQSQLILDRIRGHL